MRLVTVLLMAVAFSGPAFAQSVTIKIDANAPPETIARCQEIRKAQVQLANRGGGKPDALTRARSKAWFQAHQGGVGQANLKLDGMTAEQVAELAKECEPFEKKL